MKNMIYEMPQNAFNFYTYKKTLDDFFKGLKKFSSSFLVQLCLFKRVKSVSRDVKGKASRGTDVISKPKNVSNKK